MRLEPYEPDHTNAHAKAWKQNLAHKAGQRWPAFIDFRKCLDSDSALRDSAVMHDFIGPPRRVPISNGILGDAKVRWYMCKLVSIDFRVSDSGHEYIAALDERGRNFEFSKKRTHGIDWYALVKENPEGFIIDNREGRVAGLATNQGRLMKMQMIVEGEEG